MLSMTTDVIARDLPGLQGLPGLGIVTPEMLRLLGAGETPGSDAALRGLITIGGAAAGASAGAAFAAGRMSAGGAIILGVLSGAAAGLAGLMISNHLFPSTPL
jgi:hypothetical protein